MLTLKIKYEYDYGDIIKDNIHSLLYSFNADEYLNMFINCCSNYEMPSDLPQIVSNFVYASDDLSYLLKLPYVKELVENICLNEKTRRNCSRFFDKFVPVFVQDFSYFKNLIIKEETLFDNCKLVSIIPYFFETLDKEKLKEAVNYFSDIISYSSEASLIYRRIYELYKKYDFDYEFYLYKSFEVKPSKEMFLIIYKDKKTFSEYFGKIKEISLPLKDNFIDFLLGRLRFEDYLESINNLSEYQQTEVFGYLLLPFLSEMSFDEIKNHKDIYDIVKKLNLYKEDDYEQSFKSTLESFNSCFDYESFDFNKAFFEITSYVKEGTDNCFGIVYRQYRSFWVRNLCLVDEINEIFKMGNSSLFNEFAAKYRRFSEFKGKIPKFR